MSYTFGDLVTDVKARSILDKASTEFDTRIKLAINTSLFRISRETYWRSLRRQATFDTLAEYTTGTGAVTVTNGSKNVSVTGATFITDGIHIGRRIDLGGSSLPYTIKTITGETTLTVDKNYDGTSSATESYKIFGQETYNVPIQSGRIAFLWHEDYGYPVVMEHISDLTFFSAVDSLEDGNTPVYWRQWGDDTIINQPREASVMRLYSSSSSDTSISVTVFGDVSGYPDYEVITTNGSNGTTAVSGSKSFTSVERVEKSASSVGRLTIDANSANTTVTVLPVGDTTASLHYKKVQLFPYPTRVFPVNVFYYKDPYRLVNDNDVHELGHDFDEAIILLATSKVNYGQSKDEGDKFFALYADEIKSLKAMNSDTVISTNFSLKRAGAPNYYTGTGSRFLSFSQLGGSYGPRS